MDNIKRIKARKILDSRGYPAFSVTLYAGRGKAAQASVPSDYSWINSYGRNSAKDIDRQIDMIVSAVNEGFAQQAVERKFKDQKDFDAFLKDYFPKQETAAFSYAISLAFARLSSGKELFAYLRDEFKIKGKPKLMPLPLFTMFNGGMIADTNLDFQEFLFIPKRQTSKTAEIGKTEMYSYIKSAADTYRELSSVLQEAGYDSDTGMQGGYAPDMDSSLEALEMIMAAASRVGLEPGRDFSLGIDIGSFALYDPESGKYLFALDQTSFAKEDMAGLYESWLSKFPITYLEDIFVGDDWKLWRDTTVSLGQAVVIAGDEVFDSKESKLREGIKEQAASAIVVKPDKVGTISDTFNLVSLAKRHGYGVIMSQRSSETNDDGLADIAVAFDAQFIKAGAVARGERVAKYNRLLEIAENIA